MLLQLYNSSYSITVLEKLFLEKVFHQNLFALPQKSKDIIFQKLFYFSKRQKSYEMLSFKSKKMTLTGRSTTCKKICCEIFRRKIGEEVNLKKTSFQIIFLRIWSQVSDAGAVPRAGSLVDLGLEVVVTELGVALKLQLHRQVLKRTGFGSLRLEPATAI